MYRTHLYYWQGKDPIANEPEINRQHRISKSKIPITTNIKKFKRSEGKMNWSNSEKACTSSTKKKVPWHLGQKVLLWQLVKQGTITRQEAKLCVIWFHIHKLIPKTPLSMQIYLILQCLDLYECGETYGRIYIYVYTHILEYNTRNTWGEEVYCRKSRKGRKIKKWGKKDYTKNNMYDMNTFWIFA